MKHVKLDAAPAAVKKFVRSLPIEPEGVGLELEGQVIGKFIPALQFSDAEKHALLTERQEMIRQARERNKGVPAHVIEREVREAVEKVRQRKES